MTEQQPRRSRRAQRPAPAGVDPRPSEHPLDAQAGEDQAAGWGDGDAAPGSADRANEERLRRDKPPHWG
ncbi:hypothetical protein [Leucobacter luti]|uniref:Uncharacterized protein n=1 Tax=Leucobacter luti TaxID=340320 RepID=A0A4Q7U035_9MICO|nr:hypothetical protein [Leucobacter luti]MBL3698849.1 hypothetical protein [Leucobacter luti]RZT66227.1 hypothetical protein EV139_1658 [Leucobacter luti]